MNGVKRAGHECFHCKQWIKPGEKHDCWTTTEAVFARKSCYFFVRPKTNYLEVVLFLGRAIKAPHVRQVVEASKTRRANIVRITHRDEVEPPITDWLREAYEFAATSKPKAKPLRRRRR
jgi:hypothetical protein